MFDMKTILLTNFYNPKPLAFVKSLVPGGFELVALDRPGHDEVIQKASDADYLLVGGRTRIDGKTLEAAPRLKMIQRSGVGLDSLDLDAIRERKIPLYVNEGINARSVAEHTLMLILSTLRRVVQADSMIRKGIWGKHDIGIDCHDLFRKRVGLIGLGNIGMHVARMLRGFDVEISYCKKQALSSEIEEDLGVRPLPLPELLATSDIISLHCPLNSETRGLIGHDELCAVKPGAILVNTARGGLVDESALLNALKNKRLAGAGLDVYEKEPLPADHPFFRVHNLVLTPHMSGITAESFGNMMQRAFQNIAMFDAGKPLPESAKRVF
jgi:D-3-phosphoglycerate dehydrogenase / 2-oxoglutarate reductase